MAVPRHRLQRELFAPVDERLLTAINVADTRKKKRRDYLLCLCGVLLVELLRVIHIFAVTTARPVAVKLHLVKPTETGFMRKREWRLRDMKTIDGINPRKRLPEFELGFADVTFRYSASDFSEKDTFINELFKVPCHTRYSTNMHLCRQAPPTCAHRSLISSTYSCPLSNWVGSIRSAYKYNSLQK